MHSAVHPSAEFPVVPHTSTPLRAPTWCRTPEPRPKVLLVDDEPHVLAGVALALRGLPCDVRTATSASRALALLDEEPCDVVVADERMPGMRGTELLAIVARDFPGSARIMLTGHANMEAALRAINEAGVVRFLLKPCPPDGLREAVSTALAACNAAVARVGARGGRGPFARHSGSTPDFADRASSTEGTASHRLTEPAPAGAASMGRRREGEASVAAWSRGVLAREQFVPYAQPILPLSNSQQPFAYELLSRVRAPDGRTVTLEEFVSAIRGHLTPISIECWTIGHVLASLREHSRELFARGITLVLNVSASWLSHDRFVQHAARELRRTDAASCLIISVSNEVLAQSGSAGRARLHRLCESGCRFGIVGSGVDLKGLRSADLPIEFMSIDGRRIREILTSRAAERAAEAAIECARQAGVRTVAPCVDSLAIANRLRSLGIDYGYGSALGTPEPLKRLVTVR